MKFILLLTICCAAWLCACANIQSPPVMKDPPQPVPENVSQHIKIDDPAIDTDDVFAIIDSSQPT